MTNTSHHAADGLVLVARLLLSWIFVHEGTLLASNFGAAMLAMGKFGVPPAIGAAAIMLQVVGGFAVALGMLARWAALALGLFCLATALLFHTGFAIRNELLHFEKDLAMAGGFFLLVARGPGRYAVTGALVRWAASAMTSNTKAWRRASASRSAE